VISAIVYDLGEGERHGAPMCGLGKHLLPVYPFAASSARDFMPYPYACSRTAREHLIRYAEIAARHDGLEEKDAAAVVAWAREFFSCFFRWPTSLSAPALETIVDIVFEHQEWPAYGPIFRSALGRVRDLLAEARAVG
jgi:hypothetical protein